MDSVHELLKMASLEIIEHNIHTRSELNVRDRIVPYYIMSHLKSGTAVVRIGEKEYVTGPGSIILLPPYTKHDHYMAEQGESLFFWWHFKFSVANVVDLIRFLRLPMISKLKAPERFEETFLKYRDINRTEATIANLLRRKAQAIEVLALIFDELIAENNILDVFAPEPFPQILFDVLNFSSSELSLQSLSNQYHLNPNYLSNRFKLYFGISPIVMRREFLLEHAKQFLLSSSMSVSEIAATLGYKDIYSFSHYFTAKVGINPTEYRSSFKQ